MERALDEDTEVFFSILLLHWVRQLFLGIPTFISDPGNLLSFLDLDHLASATYRFNGRYDPEVFISNMIRRDYKANLNEYITRSKYSLPFIYNFNKHYLYST